MGRVRVYNDNPVSENYHTFGTNLASARKAFHDMEAATKDAEIDISIAAFLSPWKDEEGGVKASLLNGEQDLGFKNGKFTASNLLNVDLEVPESYKGKLNSVLLDGGGNGSKESMLSPWAYFMTGNSSAQLGRILRVDYSGEGAGKFLRDYAFSKKCAAIPDETNVHLLYREKDGIKKVFGCFVKKPHYLLLDDVLECVNEVSKTLGKDFRVSSWDIYQKTRSVSFKDKDDCSMTFTWADSIINIPSVTYKGVEVKLNDEANITADVLNLAA